MSNGVKSVLREERRYKGLGQLTTRAQSHSRENRENRCQIAAGQQATFAYSGPAGLPIYLDILEDDFDLLTVELRDSGGAVVFTASATSVPFVRLDDAGPFFLPRSGNYTLTVRGNGPMNTGDFALRLLNLQADATPLAVSDTVLGTLTPGHAAVPYRLTATAGQQILLDSLVSTTLTHRLARPGEITTGRTRRSTIGSGCWTWPVHRRLPWTRPRRAVSSRGRRPTCTASRAPRVSASCSRACSCRSPRATGRSTDRGTR